MQETQVWPLGQGVPLEKGMATHSSILAWEIPWTEEPGRLQSMELQRVGHNWMTNRQDWERSALVVARFPYNCFTTLSSMAQTKYTPWSWSLQATVQHWMQDCQDLGKDSALGGRSKWILKQSPGGAVMAMVGVYSSGTPEAAWILMAAWLLGFLWQPHTLPQPKSSKFSSVQSLSHVWLFATPWTIAWQASLSITNSQSLLKSMSIMLVIPSNHPGKPGELQSMGSQRVRHD